MSKIEEQTRHDLLKELSFNDTYKWQVDRDENHRLIHLRTGEASDWHTLTSPAVLHDKFILPKFFSLYLPTETLMRWEVVNT